MLLVIDYSSGNSILKIIKALHPMSYRNNKDYLFIGWWQINPKRKHNSSDLCFCAWEGEISRVEMSLWSPITIWLAVASSDLNELHDLFENIRWKPCLVEKLVKWRNSLVCLFIKCSSNRYMGRRKYINN